MPLKSSGNLLFLFGSSLSAPSSSLVESEPLLLNLHLANSSLSLGFIVPLCSCSVGLPFFLADLWSELWYSSKLEVCLGNSLLFVMLGTMLILLGGPVSILLGLIVILFVARKVLGLPAPMILGRVLSLDKNSGPFVYLYWLLVYLCLKLFVVGLIK